MSKKMEDGTRTCNDRIKKLREEEKAEELLEERTLKNLTLGLEEQRNASKRLEKKFEELQSRIEDLGGGLGKLKKSSRKAIS